MKGTINTEKAVRITAHLTDFMGDVNTWKLNFYELWRYEMTWGFAYNIAIRESKRNGVFVDLIIHPGYQKSLLDTMEELGYKNIQMMEIQIGMADAYELDDIEEIYMEW